MHRVLFAPVSFSTLTAVDNEDIHRRRTRELFPVQSTALLLPSKIPPTAPSCLVHKANQKGIIRLLFNPVVLSPRFNAFYTRKSVSVLSEMAFRKGRKNFTKIVYFRKSLFTRFKKNLIIIFNRFDFSTCNIYKIFLTNFFSS